MASVIEEKFLSGGSGLTPRGSAGQPTVTGALRDGAGDIDEIRSALQALADKLDADAGVTDTDYRATLDGILSATANLTAG